MNCGCLEVFFFVLKIWVILLVFVRIVEYIIENDNFILYFWVLYVVLCGLEMRMKVMV